VLDFLFLSIVGDSEKNSTRKRADSVESIASSYNRISAGVQDGVLGCWSPSVANHTGPTVQPALCNFSWRLFAHCMLTELVGKCCTDCLLSTQFRCQDGRSSPIPPTLRTVTQCQQNHVVRGMVHNHNLPDRLYILHILDRILLYTQAQNLEQTYDRKVLRRYRYHHHPRRIQYGH
jgi:hypothetical protein